MTGGYHYPKEGSRGMKGLHTKLIAVVCAIVVVGLAWYIFNEIKKSRIQKEMTGIVKTGSDQLQSLAKLGVAEDDERIMAIKQRVAYAQKELDALAKSWNVVGLQRSKYAMRVRSLEKQLKIQRDMAHNYQQEIHNLQKLGLADSDAQVEFAVDKLHESAVAIAQIEQQLTKLSVGLSKAETQKINELLAVCRNSIDAYGQEMEEYSKLGVSDRDPKMQFAREQMIEKCIEIGELQEKLMP